MTEIKPSLNLFQRRPLLLAAAGGFLIGVFALLAILWLGNSLRDSGAPAPPPVQGAGAAQAHAVSGSAITDIYAHNLRLHQGPDFRVYIQWLRGKLRPSHPGVTPTFDDPESFYLDLTNGVMRINLGDINNYLNAKSANAPLRDIRMSGTGDQVKITGKLHKLITLPIELTGVIKPGPNNRIQIHVTKIKVLKIPFKAVLGGLHVTLADFMRSGRVSGVEVEGDDIYFNPQLLLPPPHILGSLTSVSLGRPDLEAVYGDAKEDVVRVESWRNFLRLQHGSLSFGKLIMHDVDLMMVDISRDAWFDLDLANYEAQLIHGYTRITPQQGLQIFMPNASEIKNAGTKDTNIQWFKNRNEAPPSEVVPKK